MTEDDLEADVLSDMAQRDLIDAKCDECGDAVMDCECGACWEDAEE